MAPLASQLKAMVSRFARRGGTRRNATDTTRPILPIVAISIMKNEQDIIEPFLRHNGRFVDLHILIDNGSADATREIAYGVARDMGHIVIADYVRKAPDHGDVITQALHDMQMVAFADFVMFLDSDEFISAPDRETLLQNLSVIPTGIYGRMPWQTILPDPDLSEDTHPEPLDRLRLRRKQELPLYRKAVLRLGGHIDLDLRVPIGNHRVLRAGKKMPFVELPDLPLFHMPVRSVMQSAGKGAVGAMAKTMNPQTDKAKKKKPHQWHMLHNLHTERGYLTQMDIAQAALDYAQDPRTGDFHDHVELFDHGVRVDRKYSDGRSADPKILVDAMKAPDKAPDFVPPSRPENLEADSGIENAFDGNWHWDREFVDVAPFRYLIKRENVGSVLDLGCSNGRYPLLYQHLGASEVLGVDGLDPSATALPPEAYRQADLQEPLDLNRTFDLVVCLEVVEHLHPEATPVIFDTIARHAEDMILFSMAGIAQPGNGHINCRPMSDILALWAERGWYPDMQRTFGLRTLATMQWFKRNMLVLRRSGGQDPAFVKALTEIDTAPFVWWRQEPGVVQEAFARKLPPAPAGYASKHLHRRKAFGLF